MSAVSPRSEATPEERVDELTLSVVIPCLNEADSIELVVGKAMDTMRREGIAGEVIVADNGSTDGSRELAERAGARVIREPRRGYGSAYLAGFAAARGRYILMGDADDTYDFTQLGAFLEPLEAGADMVIGNRFAKIHPGAMPWLHRYVGNPILTGILNLFFRTGVRDAHCGMRAFRRDRLKALDLRTTGMEFASEHVIRAGKLGLDIREIDIEYHPRKGESKLSSFSDGWRHLRFLLIHSPTWLFLVPGAILAVFGILVSLVVVTGLNVLGREWDLHALIGGALLAIVGAQVIQFGGFGRAYAAYYLGEHDPLFDRLRDRLRLEHGLLAGGAVLLAGIAMCAVVVIKWLDRGFGELREEKLAIMGLTLVVLGIQLVFGAFFLSVLGLHRRPRASDELLDET
jgi:glycosyltransferase involved in cell wall biosynthesis